MPQGKLVAEPALDPGSPDLHSGPSSQHHFYAFQDYSLPQRAGQGFWKPGGNLILLIKPLSIQGLPPLAERVAVWTVSTAAQQVCRPWPLIFFGFLSTELGIQNCSACHRSPIVSLAINECIHHPLLSPASRAPCMLNPAHSFLGSCCSQGSWGSPSLTLHCIEWDPFSDSTLHWMGPFPRVHEACVCHQSGWTSIDQGFGGPHTAQPFGIHTHSPAAESWRSPAGDLSHWRWCAWPNPQWSSHPGH